MNKTGSTDKIDLIDKLNMERELLVLSLTPFFETKSTLQPTIPSISSAKSINRIPILSENSTSTSKSLESFCSLRAYDPKIAMDFIR